ncbi:MAG: sodium/proton-translocating pyrophosphatase, partial [Phycisphaerales bacterium]|nr:sodium/proton-translocating pyrophosphatase [Phycisphaerales bacterium]
MNTPFIKRLSIFVLPLLLALFTAVPALAQPGAAQVTAAAPAAQHVSELDIVMPDFTGKVVPVKFLNNSFSGQQLLTLGLLVCVLGMGFAMAMYMKLKGMPVHKSMLDISELIYETCKAYLLRQGKFLLILWAFVAAAMLVYFKFLRHVDWGDMALIIIFSLIGIAGSYGVAWFGIRVNTFANSRAAFGSLRGKPWPCYDVPLKAGMSIGMALISVELFIMLVILLFLPSDVAAKCFIGFAIGESLGAAVLRIAGGIFTKIADIGSDLMKVVFKIKEDDA